MLSPHLDDAVLSAFSVLAAPGEVVVVNVFDGLPEPGPASFTARLSGATDRVELMRRRHREDEEALAGIGRGSVGLGFLDCETRTGGLSADAIAEAVGRAVPAATLFLAPMRIGQHPDHELVRDAAIALSAASGAELRLYADVPYATACGWPYWVTGEAPDPHLDPMVVWEAALSSVSVPLGEPVVTRLDGALLARKQAALSAYASQLSMLAGGPHRRLGDWALEFEVFWPVLGRDGDDQRSSSTVSTNSSRFGQRDL